MCFCVYLFFPGCICSVFTVYVWIGAGPSTMWSSGQKVGWVCLFWLRAMDTHLYSTVYLNMLLNVCVGHLERLKKKIRQQTRSLLPKRLLHFLKKKKRKKEVRYLIPSGSGPQGPWSTWSCESSHEPRWEGWNYCETSPHHILWPVEVTWCKVWVEMKPSS